MPIFLKNNVNHWSDDISHNSWREMKQMKISKYRNRPRLEIIFNRGFPWIRTVLWKKRIENLDEEVRDGKVLWNGSVKKKKFNGWARNKCSSKRLTEILKSVYLINLISPITAERPTRLSYHSTLPSSCWGKRKAFLDSEGTRWFMVAWSYGIYLRVFNAMISHAFGAAFTCRAKNVPTISVICNPGRWGES